MIVSGKFGARNSRRILRQWLPAQLSLGFRARDKVQLKIKLWVHVEEISTPFKIKEPVTYSDKYHSRFQAKVRL